MFMGLVLAGVVRDAEDLLHAFEESSLKSLALISNQHRLTHTSDTAIPPRQGKLVHCIRVNAETESGETYENNHFGCLQD